VIPGQARGEIKSIKSINDLISPLAGTVHARNEILIDTAEVVNIDPYGQGWIFDVERARAALEKRLALLEASAHSSLISE
jgi:glycine cleavage system H protein